MQTLLLDHLLPNVFAGMIADGDKSDIWLQEVRLERGETILIEAESGRGKTSLCSYVVGLRSDYAGQIRYLSEQGEELSIEPCELLRRHIGIMFQEHRIFGELTAVENVMLKNQLTQFYTEQQVRSQLSELGLSQQLDRPCATLSLGQQQRVAFVRALAQPCSFLLLDEPISHLDPTNAEVMVQMLRQRQLADGLGVIVTSVGHRLPCEYSQILKL